MMATQESGQQAARYEKLLEDDALYGRVLECSADKHFFLEQSILADIFKAQRVRVIEKAQMSGILDHLGAQKGIRCRFHADSFQIRARCDAGA